MKVKTTTEDLSRAIAIAMRGVSSKTHLPITKELLLRASESGLEIESTNLTTYISAGVNAQVEREGMATTPARIMSDFIRSLPQGSLEMELDGRTMRFAQPGTRAEINGMNPEEFPERPTGEEGAVARFDPQTLRRAIRSVAMSAAVEESRPVLTGVKMEATNDRFTFATADGYRMSLYEGNLTEDIEGANEISILIPARELRDIDRWLGGRNEPVSMSLTANENFAVFSLTEVETTIKLLRGTFPAYRKLIPDNPETIATVQREDLEAAARTINAFSTRDQNTVRIYAERESEGSDRAMIRLAVINPEIGDQRIEMHARVEGEEDMKIGLNARYLADVISAMESDEIAVKTTTLNAPMVISPAKGDDGFSYTHVIMPMFVADL